MTRLLAAAIATALVLPPQPVAAAPAREPRTHDGFFLRLSGGAGHAKTSSTSVADGSVDASGLSADLNVAVGGSVSPNLAVHATLWGWGVPSPDANVGPDVSLSMSAVGAGFTYWFLPANIYVSPSLGVGTLSLSQGRTNVTTDSGLALDGTIGKEWWTHDEWGLGIAGSLSYHVIPDESRPENWTGLGFGIRFSATMN